MIHTPQKKEVICKLHECFYATGDMHFKPNRFLNAGTVTAEPYASTGTLHGKRSLLVLRDIKTYAVPCPPCTRLNAPGTPCPQGGASCPGTLSTYTQHTQRQFSPTLTDFILCWVNTHHQITRMVQVVRIPCQHTHSIHNMASVLQTLCSAEWTLINKSPGQCMLSRYPANTHSISLVL